ncbi:sigma-54 dependent transcriptional regulator [Pelagicoccus sp. SDUM812002]|uniref:sigma-54-dependent transcriptional regulator n=1 Tax=Pelagicoccus sp. SDUM812002 TaxID=3041266 RepID=UPI00280DFDFD|nr:sigma-54 dependent transcriptional regulator [Pelagicoccus sp. SDUM812002]MDQ8185285.1 sigma-54 dependent transcriptional regulator [Pelagicoccus sp. SDUM812002]
MKILIVDDESNIQKTTALSLKTMGHQSVSAFSGSQALRKLGEDRFDAVFLDLRLGEENGLDVFDEMRKQGFEMPVIMFTAYSSIETAIEATRKGIFDYVAKPFVPEQIRQALRKLEDSLSLANKVTELESRLADKSPGIRFESQDSRMQQIYKVAEKAAKSDANILLLGPSGTGKTVLSRRIHEMSDRTGEPFVVVHCPSLSKELLESELFGHLKGSFTGAVKDTWGKVDAAEGGTLFLDEVADIPLEVQSKLLRLLQERLYERIGETKTRAANVRILAATNKDLQEEVREGRFREDLFYRLNVISLHLPGLAERKRDLEILVSDYVEFYARKMGREVATVEEDALEAILAYNWPGNLRELNNVVERCLILCSGNTVTLSDLPNEISGAAQTGSGSALINGLGNDVTLQALEDEHIKRVLERCDSLEQAARTLGIDSATLYRKRKKLGLL